MVHLRATAKLLRSMTLSEPSETPSDTALGDWYAKRVVIDRIPILVMIASKSLLPILLRARDVRSLPDAMPSVVRARLHRLGVPGALIDAEIDAMEPVRVSKTQDRSVLGVLVDFAGLLPHYLPDRWNEGDFVEAEGRLQGTPCYCSSPGRDVVFPDRDTLTLLEARWDRGPS